MAEEEQGQETSKYIVTWTDGIDFIREPVVAVGTGENRVFRTTAPVAPSRDGRTFLGWQSQRNGGELVQPGADVIVTRSETYFASWDINKYTVKFYEGEGDDTVFATLQVEHGSLISSFPVLHRDGYMFLGWFLENRTRLRESQVVYGNMVCHAHWTAIQYTVKFENGIVLRQGVDIQQEELGPLDCALQGTYNVSDIPFKPSSTPTNDRYDFVKWVRKLPNGDYSDEPQRQLENDVVFVAVWKDKMCNVRFNPAGGTLSEESVRIVKYGNEIGTLPTVARDGHTFQGWTDQNGNPVTDEFVVTRDMTVSAKWSVHSITVNFHPNGGSFTAQGTQYPTPTGEDYSISDLAWGSVIPPLKLPSQPENEFHHFIGWCHDSNGTGSILNSLNGIMMKPEHRDDGEYQIDFYAIYRHDTRTITWNANGGSFDRFSTDQFKDDIVRPPQPTPSMDGYIFDGWHSTLNNQTESTKLREDATVQNDATYYASWSEDTIMITFNSNGGH